MEEDKDVIFKISILVAGIQDLQKVQTSRGAGCAGSMSAGPSLASLALYQHLGRHDFFLYQYFS